MPITGTTKAPLFAQFGTARFGATRFGYQSYHQVPLYAIFNIARFGATRFGYHSSHAFINVGGAEVGYTHGDGRVLLGSLHVTDDLNDQPNTCRFTMRGVKPVVGQPVKLRLGTTRNGVYVFTGSILSVQQVYTGDRPANLQYQVAAIDPTWQLGFKTITAFFGEQSATPIAQALIAVAAGEGFTADVEANLPTVVGGITFTNEDLPQAVTRLCNRIGASWRIEDTGGVKTVRVFRTITGQNPRPLDNVRPLFSDFFPSWDLSQTITRVYVEGRGTKVIADVPVGSTTVPVEAADMFTPGAGIFLKASFKGADGGAQLLTFTGVVHAAGGAIVGPGVTPGGALVAAIASGAGIEPGVHQYAYTWVTASGETAPSPLTAITVAGSEAAPTTAPSGTAQVGSGLGLGAYRYVVTFTNAAGETLPSAASAAVTTRDVADPTVKPTVTIDTSGGSGNIGTVGQGVDFAYCYSGFSGAMYRTGRSPTTHITQKGDPYSPGLPCPVNVTMTCSTDPSVSDIEVHIKEQGEAGFSRVAYVSNNPAGGTVSIRLSNVGKQDPIAAGFPVRQIAVTVPKGGAGILGRKVYRTAANGATYGLRSTLADNVTTFFTDAAADASLGAAPPVTGTAVNAQVALSGIAVGPSAVTARKVYRSAAGAALLKLQQTIANNTATTGVQDATPDASLGATAPANDTSGLTQPTGQVPPGSPSIVVTSTAFASAAGGWALVNGNQVIRYGGVSGNSLVGIPATGDGAIVAVVPYNSSIVGASVITGIPASGDGSITRALLTGDEIYLVVQRDNGAAQTALAARLGGTGIIEEWIQDRRLSIAEATTRGDAFLTTRPLDPITLTYTTRDLRTKSGQNIVVNVVAPTDLTGVFLIQHVEIGNFRPHGNQPPTFTVHASSVRYTFEQLIGRS